ncbi:hypothetical protein L6452_00796 [Arctium lappa]|uniref:Uncharacterized protein n=1 Tax=Arctium lappa TaxID=4217 RepID=A0ACB9FFB0_ARCLA|nr:hypothetical protein L6452_00796 [Arctium lappa]
MLSKKSNPETVRRPIARIMMKTAFSRFVNTPDDPVCFDGVTPTVEAKKDDGQSSRKKSDDRQQAKGKEVEEGMTIVNNEKLLCECMLERRCTQTAIVISRRFPKVGIKIDDAGVSGARKKEQKKKGKEKKANPQRPVLGIRTLTSPMILQQILYELSDDQKVAVERMGLGSFIGMTVDGIPSRLGYFVVNNLDTNNMELRLNHGTIIINEETVHQILLVPIGGIDLTTIDPDSESEALASAWKNSMQRTR